MKSKKKRSNDAVAEIVGTVMMLGMAVSLISMVYISVLSYPFTPSPISADLIGSIDGNSIIIEHHGGDSLSLSTEIAVTVGGSTTRITVEDYLDDESKADGLWNIGERVVYSPIGGITDYQVKVAVVDVKSNSAILMGILQDGEILPLSTSVNTISPYEITFSPLTTTVTGDLGLDNVTLYYRWSEDNWTIGWTTLTYDDFEDGTSGNYTGSGIQAADYNVNSNSIVDGTYSLHLQDNTGANWALTNDIAADTNGYTQIRVDFSFLVDDFNNPGTEDWWLQYYNDSTSNWETVYDYDCGVGTYIDQQSGGNWDTAGVLRHTYYFNESEGWSLSDDFNIRFYCDASGNGDELYIDSIYINATTGLGSSTDWDVWNDGSNPDTNGDDGWSWEFDFPNSIGYYEFYSIGMYNGGAEDASSSADAICKYEE